MDPTAILAGLVNLLEERYGRFGRFLSHIVLLSLVFSIACLPIATLGSIFNWTPLDFGGRTWGNIIVSVAIMSSVGLMMYLLWWFTMRKLQRSVFASFDNVSKMLENVREDRKRSNAALSMAVEKLEEAEEVRNEIVRYFGYDSIDALLEAFERTQDGC